VHLQHVTVASLADRYAERLTPLWPGRFARLALFTLEVSRVSLDSRSRYARNYARGRPLPARFHPPPAKGPKKNPSASPRLTEGFYFARLLDRPVC
jgi:hypothetical protein